MKPFQTAVSSETSRAFGHRFTCKTAKTASKVKARGAWEMIPRWRRAGGGPTTKLNIRQALQAALQSPGCFSQAVTLLLFKFAVRSAVRSGVNSHVDSTSLFFAVTAPVLRRSVPMFYPPARDRKAVGPWYRAYEGVRMHPVRGIYPRS